MFNDYIKALLPIPITDIRVSESNKYKYKITTYAKVADEAEKIIKNRVNKCKRIKSFNGWFYDNDTYFKYAIIEFVNF